MFGMTNAAGETETRAAKWKQQPVMTIVITFAPGLRKMRAELIRRMDAWKEFARIQETAPFPINCSDRDVLVALTQHGIPQSTTASPDWGTVRPDWRRARLCSTSTVWALKLQPTQSSGRIRTVFRPLRLRGAYKLMGRDYGAYDQGISHFNVGVEDNGVWCGDTVFCLMR